MGRQGLLYDAYTLNKHFFVARVGHDVVSHSSGGGWFGQAGRWGALVEAVARLWKPQGSGAQKTFNPQASTFTLHPMRPYTPYTPPLKPRIPEVLQEAAKRIHQAYASASSSCGAKNAKASGPLTHWAAAFRKSLSELFSRTFT